MRLDARNGDFGWAVFHVEWVRELRCVVWVDTDLNQWGGLGRPLVVEGRANVVTRNARRIEIYPDRRLVLINPIEDADANRAHDAEVGTQAAVHREILRTLPDVVRLAMKPR